MDPSRRSQRPQLSLPSIRDVLPDQFQGGRSTYPSLARHASSSPLISIPNPPRQPALRDREQSAPFQVSSSTAARHGGQVPAQDLAQASTHTFYTYPPPGPPLDRHGSLHPLHRSPPFVHNASTSGPPIDRALSQGIPTPLSLTRPHHSINAPSAYEATGSAESQSTSPRLHPVTPMSPALSTSDSDVSDDNSLDNTSSYADDGSRARSYGADGKRHACPHCYKRFNRPSSLEIHINTHTGVRPFRCPHPDCGKDFNVKSNMRRHYKNHFTTAAPSSPYGSASVSYDPPAVGSDLQIIRCHQYPASASATYAAESRAPNREGQRRRALSWEV